MSTPILATKLYIPPLPPNAVLRPRLIERLHQGVHRKLTLISAPAGFGKTTLVSEWIDACRRPTAWLSLDEGHNDPNLFLTYLVTALQTLWPQLGKSTMELLHTPQQTSMESVLTILLNDISETADDFILVLDDYHLIDAKGVDDVLAFVLQHQPACMHLVIATREDPDLPLARLRARGQLTELRAADLRFTPGEAGQFFSQAFGLDLSDEQICTLDTRTEGWIAGLQLAAISMQGISDTTGFIRSFTGSHHFVMDYLVEEVLQQQPEPIQTFLLRTAILDRLCGSLCDAVLNNGSTSGQSTLASLQQANLFIIPLDNERRWYRYHHLFADLLRQRLPQSLTASAGDDCSLAQLHGRASAWYEANGYLPEALQHAVTAEDMARVAALAERAWPNMDAMLQSDTWRKWVDHLSEAMIRQRPVLNVCYAWALLSEGDLEGGEARFQEVEQWIIHGGTASKPLDEMVVVDKAQFKTLPATIATGRAYIAQARNDVTGTVTYAHKALDLLPDTDHLHRGSASGLLGCAYWTDGQLEASHRFLSQSMEYLYLSGNIAFALSVTMGTGGVRLAQGRLRDAMQAYEEALQLAEQQDMTLPPILAEMHVGLSVIHCEQGNFEVALKHLHYSKTSAELAAFSDWQYRWRLAQARIQTAQGDLDSALGQLHAAERIYFQTPFPNLRPVPALKATIWIRQERHIQALEWVKEQGLSIEDTLSYLSEYNHITLARVLIAAYRYNTDEQYLADALTLLERLFIAADESNRTGSVIEILVVHAMGYQAQGNIPLALERLKKALCLAETEGYVCVFADEGMPMASLLSELASSGIQPQYCNRLLAAIYPDSSNPHQHLNPLGSQPLAEPLSKRELEVLQLIAQGLSNRQISERLFLAITTVKGHNQNIFGKLSVQRRTEAVARARKLGILEPLSY